MDLFAVLLTGLLAGGISCAAVQGGLLAGLITRQQHPVPAATSRRHPPVPAGGPRAPSPTGRRHSPAPPAPATPLAQLGDDLAPVGGFLAGKLLSHAVLGALLGGVGQALQLSAGLRTGMQLAAGVLIIVFGLAQLGVPGFRRVVIEPPPAATRIVRSRSRSQNALAPALLGLATVPIPCGVTLSVAALALTSGSAAAGAATMAVFVVGTAPLFALLGYAARRAATAWRGRLAAATGVVVLVMGLVTLNGGLELAGSPLAASRLGQTLGLSTPATADTSTVSTAAGTQTVVITARTGSYSPRNVAVRAGVPTTLLVRSEGAQGCVRSFLVPDLGVDEVLPVRGETRIDLGVLPPGSLAYSCGMGMYTGTITAA